jgi:hypothetical protein
LLAGGKQTSPGGRNWPTHGAAGTAVTPEKTELVARRGDAIRAGGVTVAPRGP